VNAQAPINADLLTGNDDSAVSMADRGRPTPRMMCSSTGPTVFPRCRRWKSGARIDFPSYSPERRAMRLVAESPSIEIKLKPMARTVNPVF
jgi:hypothetical protein